MVDPRIEAVQYAQNQQQNNLDTLIEFVKIPSISTEPDHQQDMLTAANWAAAQLRSMGFKNVQIFPTPKHPIVFGELIQSPSMPTVLIYGHYDVQPAEPLELWQTPPFEPTVRGENLYARGASDMKGQIVATLSAVRAYLHSATQRINFKYILEGEEEIGSPNLAAFLQEHKEMLACTFALNPDSGMVSQDLPTIVNALRGLAYYELRVYGPQHDLHSGQFGGAVQNPAIVLSELIAGMHDARGRITLPGFYDKVRPLTDRDRKAIASLPLTDEYYLKNIGAPALWGEEGYTPSERTGARPTLDVNGLYSGFTGPGSKTVIPAWAMAKISMRLVPFQDPVKVEEQLRLYIKEHAPRTVRWELITYSGGEACETDLDYPAVKALYKALSTVWGKEPVYKREGGSIPVVVDMKKILGVESIVTGFGLPDDNLHAPNEKLHLPTWYRGIEALIHLFFNLTEMAGQGKL
ncbi:MAG TPA: dipeptidase [Anaerolineaceae bacterium]|nr:dipeptidase [Anaerolineaceae bacterium]